MYLETFEAERWPLPTINSASARVSPLSGDSGVKMTGPYAWVPPGYWTDATAATTLGGASGFISETSPGAAPMSITSLKKAIPPDMLWPAGYNGTTIPDAWEWHCGSPYGLFGTLKYFSLPLVQRLGHSASAEAFSYKSQLQAYETHRAMFEAYSIAKYGSFPGQRFATTGIIQWMLNSAWPSNMWHL